VRANIGKTLFAQLVDARRSATVVATARYIFRRYREKAPQIDAILRTEIADDANQRTLFDR
jgi:hypothetical protein